MGKLRYKKPKTQYKTAVIVLLLFQIVALLILVQFFKVPLAKKFFNQSNQVSAEIDFEQCQNEVKNYHAGVRVNFGVYNSSNLLNDGHFRSLRAGVIRVPMLVKDPAYTEQNAEEIEFIDNALKCGYYIIYVYNPSSPLLDEDIKSDLSQIIERIPYGSKFAVEVGNEPNSSFFWTPSGEGLDYGFSTFADFARQTVNTIQQEFQRDDIQIVIGALDLQWNLEDYLNSDDKENHNLIRTIKQYHAALSERLGPLEDQNYWIAIHGYHYADAPLILTDLHRYYLNNKAKFVVSEAGVTNNDNPDELKLMMEKSLNGENSDVESVVVHEYNGGLDQLGQDFKLTDYYGQPRDSYWALYNYIQNNTNF